MKKCLKLLSLFFLLFLQTSVRVKSIHRNRYSVRFVIDTLFQDNSSIRAMVVGKMVGTLRIILHSDFMIWAKEKEALFEKTVCN
jgi:hypothetical protein